jgi:hypothetical protein
MARAGAERERRVEAAERFGRLGRPLPHWFLDGRSGCGAITLVAVAVVALVALAAAA